MVAGLELGQVDRRASRAVEVFPVLPAAAKALFGAELPERDRQQTAWRHPVGKTLEQASSGVLSGNMVHDTEADDEIELELPHGMGQSLDREIGSGQSPRRITPGTSGREELHTGIHTPIARRAPQLLRRKEAEARVATAHV